MHAQIDAFNSEIQLIAGSSTSGLRQYYEAEVLAGDKRIIPLGLLSVDINRDFVNNYCDEVVVELQIPYGTYVEHIAPYRQNLRIVLKKQTVSILPGQTTDDRTATETFRATLIDAKQESTAPKSTLTGDADAANLAGSIPLSFQLQPIAIEQLRFFTFGAVFRTASPGEVLKAVFTKASQQLNLDADQQIKGVTMFPVNNTEKLDAVVIPHGTRLMDLPDYLQKKSGGIYSSDLAFYLLAGQWFIWPLYDLSRSTQTPKKVTFLVVPPNLLNGIERTYRTTDNQLIVLITGGTEHVDAVDEQLAVMGNGIRFPDARNVFNGMGEVADNKITVARGANTNEFILKKRASGLNNIVRSTQASRNIYAETSKYASYLGGQMVFQWQNADPSLLRPDLPVEVMYLKDNLVKTLKGTLLGVKAWTGTTGNGVTNRQHQTHCVVRAFVEGDLPEFATFIDEQGPQVQTPPKAF